MFWREEKIRVIAEDIWLPSDLDSEVSEWLVKESDMKSSVNFVFWVPLLRIIADSWQFLLVFLFEREFLEVGVVSCEELWKSPDSIVLKDITKITNVIGHTDFLDFIDWLSSVEFHNERAYCEELSIFDFDSFFWNVHPSSTLTAKVKHIEVLEPIELELCMFWSQSSSFYLQCESIEFGLSWAKEFSIFVSGNVEEAILEDSLNTVESVLDLDMRESTWSSLI